MTKRLVATLVTCGAIAFAVIVLLTVSYYGVRRENKMLQKDLDKTSAELVVANKAKETALVRLMVLEEEITPDEKEDESAPSQKPPERVSEKPKPSAPLEEETQEIVAQEVEPAAEAPAAEPVEASEETEPVPPKIVAVQKLQIRQPKEGGALRYEFIVRNIDPEGRRLKGYTFVVLKPDKGSKEPPVVAPSTRLKDGSPLVSKEGQYFSIMKYKPVRGTFTNTQAMEPFKTATIYVYSDKGDLLLEQVHEVDKISAS